MSLNDILQWIAVGVILLIVVITIVRRSMRFGKQIRRDDCGPGCGCGCGCSKCEFTKNSNRKTNSKGTDKNGH